VAGGWRRLYNEELHKLYASPNIFRMMGLITMRWAGHGARMRNSYNILGQTEGRDDFKKLCG
jgi:hypothetical protein